MVAQSNTWLNSDGLFIKFGPSEAASPTQAGFVCQYGPNLVYVYNLDLTTLDQNEVIINDVLVIPKNSLIQYVETVSIVGAATGTAIDLGLCNIDRNTASALNASATAADPDGLLAAAPTANMNTAGEWSVYKIAATIPTGLTGVGALIGSIMTNPTIVTCSRTDATAYTTGKIQVRIGVVPEALTGFSVVHS